MKVDITKREAQELFAKTGKLKYKILAHMVDWTSDPEYVEEVILKAEHEYNQLRCFIGDQYPRGKCANIIELFQLLEKQSSSK